ncbi:MAG: DUF6067 family protein [Kiritimatiellae bacterium]|nr:DUF6067 family protein [Kiritimatiellia bacterium]
MRTIQNIALVGIVLVATRLMVVSSTLAADPPPQVSIPEMVQAPKLDGVIETGEWQDAVGNYGFANVNGAMRLNDREARFWVGRKGETLYIAIQTETPPGDSVLIRTQPDATRDIPEAFYDDNIELVLDPNRGRTSGDRTFYHIISSANGAMHDWSVDPDNKANPKSTVWRLPEWTMTNTVHDGSWDIELAIPFPALGAHQSDLATPWGMRIARNWQRPFQQSQWESVGGDYDAQSTMPVVVWDDTAPVTQVLSLYDRDKSLIRVNLRNPHAAPLDVAVYMQDAWHSDQLQVLKKTITLEPNTEQVLELTSPDGGPGGDHRTIINLTSPDGKKTYYFRDFKWNLHRAHDAWQVAKRESKKVDLKFKFYPSYNKIRVWVNAKGLDKARVTGASAEALKLEGTERKAGKRYWHGRLEFKDGISETIAEIPELPDGDYRLMVKLEGENVSPEPLVQDFIRRHFEWEHNKLGISDKVIPPFTPLKARGATVQCVLREMTHGDAGLWDKVVSQDKDILAGPMRWEVEMTDGSKPAIKGAGWKAVSRRETEVVGRTKWQAGALRADLETRYDYDGMMKCTLTLKPCETAVNGLTLKMPVDDGRAGFMHACGDHLRQNYAGQTPTGSGRVWDSSKGNKTEIVGTFYPYIWLGDGERGLCWFADTDRDWVLDDKTPVIDLVREGKTLWLNVHFITRPAHLVREHKIVFGLQATPTKPMPDGWRRWTFGGTIPGARPVALLGASYYWGNTLGCDSMPYPFEKDFTFFREMKRLRETGQTDARTAEFLENWMKRIAAAYHAPEGSANYEDIRVHVNAGMSMSAGTAWKDGVRLVPYTNARGVAFRDEEFATFQDEWLNYSFFNREWDPNVFGNGVAYDVTPTTSMIECLLWYYQEMLTCLDGVYWDNTFLAARQDPVVGDGTWTDDRGRVHPGLGLFALRELVKRTAVFFAEEERKLPQNRKPLVIMAHMTNTELVPVLSFLNCTYDWEWKYGEDDFQDRFTWDLAVAETIGRQVGAWPTILAGGNWDPKGPRYEWLMRNRLGVCLVHEIWAHCAGKDPYAKLFEFGYGSPGCTVYNYWQDGHPAIVTGDQVIGKTLVIAKPGAAIVAITDYGEGGLCRVKLDLAKLGLDQDVAAVNFESGESVKRIAPGEFEVQIPKHDFRIITVGQPR